LLKKMVRELLTGLPAGQAVRKADRSEKTKE
jgi:hypothetical protein